ncbi:MAG TPA: metallophosphoesterase family protein [Stellaceae bacterium]|nr:metallophosphoesterase family protein [Stellaceae bacterium]
MSRLGRLFGRVPTPPPAAPAVPEGTRVYAVGDIHGRGDLLESLHDKIRQDAFTAQAPRNVVVYLGDYVDRGPDSAQVIDLLINRPLLGFEHVHLKGNHETAMLHFLVDAQAGIDWMSFGGDATLFSYGVRPPQRLAETDGLERAQAELLQVVPRSHLAFLTRLQPYHIENDFFFVHAGIRPGVPFERQTEEDLLWIRGPFLDSGADFGKIVVHGHTIDEQPVLRRNRIGIDTGAYTTGKLTCLVIEGAEYGFLQT